VKRAANLAAHELAKVAIKIWTEEVPMCIFDIVTVEQLVLPVYGLWALDVYSFLYEMKSDIFFSFFFKKSYSLRRK
jgi:hypothetical protein